MQKKSVKTVKTIKTPKVKDPVVSPSAEANPETKKRGRTKKAPPTREETLKALQEEADQIRQNLQDLREDEGKLASVPLKLANQLVREEIEDLTQDLEIIESERNQILALPLDQE